MDTKQIQRSISNGERKRRAAKDHNARYARGGVFAVAARGLIVAKGMGNRAGRNAALLKNKTSRSRPLSPNRAAEAKERGHANIMRFLARVV